MADETLMELIDAYTEARHIGGCHTYNVKTAEARKTVSDALMLHVAAKESVATAAQLALETLERTHKSLERQLELIADRAPGSYLDKRPVVNTLTMHQKRTEAAAIALRSALSYAPLPFAEGCECANCANGMGECQRLPFESEPAPPIPASEAKEL